MLIYQGPNNQQGGIDIDNKIATDNLAQVVSTSWGYPETVAVGLTVNGGSSYMATENQIFQRMAAQGQSMFAASGDSGAYDDGTTIDVDDPASQPFVTGVGGTSLTGSVSTPVERAWNSCGTGKCLQTGGGSSGGGVSAVWPIFNNSNPTYNYQVGVPGLASPTNRNVPDVSLNADPNSSPYYIVVLGGPGFEGGTSAAAPLWAAFTALLNQGSSIAGASPLGFANPKLYQLDNNASTYAVNFNDVTSGDNGNYSAHAGYDNVTGLGEFQRHGYFGGLRLSPEAPRLYLVAPALRIHPATEVVLRYLSPRVEWTLIGLDERWRAKVKAVWRKRSGALV